MIEALPTLVLKAAHAACRKSRLNSKSRRSPQILEADDQRRMKTIMTTMTTLTRNHLKSASKSSQKTELMILSQVTSRTFPKSYKLKLRQNRGRWDCSASFFPLDGFPSRLCCTKRSPIILWRIRYCTWVCSNSRALRDGLESENFWHAWKLLSC